MQNCSTCDTLDMSLWAADAAANLGELVDAENTPDVFPVLLHVRYLANVERRVA